MKPRFSCVGFAVIESAENYEQVLSLVVRPELPPLGILEWSDNRDLRTVFLSRAEARAAIQRTTAYAKAFVKEEQLPQAKYCTIVPVRQVQFVDEQQEGKGAKA